MQKNPEAVAAARVASQIRVIRGQRVRLDSGGAGLYGATTKRFNEKVKRNRARFPSDFLLQLGEAEALGSQLAALKTERHRLGSPSISTRI